jgi:hypothetical protein
MGASRPGGGDKAPARGLHAEEEKGRGPVRAAAGGAQRSARQRRTRASVARREQGRGGEGKGGPSWGDCHVGRPGKWGKAAVGPAQEIKFEI